MSQKIETPRVPFDPLSHPAVVDGKPRARLWFLMLAVIYERDDVPDDVRQVITAACEMAKELERRVECGNAAQAERDSFRYAFDIIEPLAAQRYKD